jgi:hypothetical protein
MSDLLLEKAYNCYIVYLDNLNYGKVSQNYCLLYDAILTISNNIEDKKYIQYFENNLNCSDLFPLNITADVNRKILWTLNNSSTVLSSFVWNEIPVPKNGLFSFTTNSLPGFNYLYISIPQSTQIIILNELNMQIYDSLSSSSSTNQLFELVGTQTVGGTANNVYKKKNVYNTFNGVLFKVQII